jgi:hypothetical protein
MGMGFLSSILPEDQDRDPVGGPRDPIQRFTAAAVEVGLIRAGDKLDRNVVELCLRVVEMAARIGDAYRVPICSEDSVGTRIRAELHE